MKNTEKTTEHLRSELIELRERIDQLERSEVERKQTEGKQERRQALMLQAEKLDAVATLAGGIAHEFNNALLGITLHLDLIEMALPVSVTVGKHIESIKTSTQRIVDLTNQLLAYGRGGKYHPSEVSLSNFLKDAPPLVQYTIDPAVRVETDLQADIHMVRVDLTQMEMVISAILNNAVEAIEREGRIKITTRSEDVDEVSAGVHPGVKPGPYVCLTVEDDGKGMDKETLGRIFEPFFSTKFHGRGLSMAAVYGVIKNHHGWISIDSNLGEGTVVRIYLPAAQARDSEV